MRTMEQNELRIKLAEMIVLCPVIGLSEYQLKLLKYNHSVLVTVFPII